MLKKPLENDNKKKHLNFMSMCMTEPSVFL